MASHRGVVVLGWWGPNWTRWEGRSSSLAVASLTYSCQLPKHVAEDAKAKGKKNEAIIPLLSLHGWLQGRVWLGSDSWRASAKLLSRLFEYPTWAQKESGRWPAICLKIEASSVNMSCRCFPTTKIHCLCPWSRPLNESSALLSLAAHLVDLPPSQSYKKITFNWGRYLVTQLQTETQDGIELSFPYNIKMTFMLFIFFFSSFPTSSVCIVFNGTKLWSSSPKDKFLIGYLLKSLWRFQTLSHFLTRNNLHFHWPVE